MGLPRTTIRQLMLWVAVAGLAFALQSWLRNDPRWCNACFFLWLAQQPVLVVWFVLDVRRASRTRDPTPSGRALLAIVILNGVLLATIVRCALQ